MQTVTLNVYPFAELSEEAQQTAISNYRSQANNDDISGEEIVESAKAVADLFNLKFGREYSELRYSHIHDNKLQMSGVRLRTYLLNNYGEDLFTPSYIKSIDMPVKWKAFICKIHKGQSGEYTQIFSKYKVDNSCVLTGMCYDDNILAPVYNFIAKPVDSVTFEDIINDIAHAIKKTFSDNEEWINSDEYITDAITINDYQYTEDGKQF